MPAKTLDGRLPHVVAMRGGQVSSTFAAMLSQLGTTETEAIQHEVQVQGDVHKPAFLSAAAAAILNA